MNSIPHPLQGGVPIGGQQVNIHEMRLLPIAAVDVIRGDYGIPHMTIALRVTDVPHGVAWIVPMRADFAKRIAHLLQEELGNELLIQETENRHVS